MSAAAVIVVGVVVTSDMRGVCVSVCVNEYVCVLRLLLFRRCT